MPKFSEYAVVTLHSTSKQTAMSNSRNRLIASPCVIVIVGLNGEKKKFFLHEELLFYESGKFRAQFQGSFSETTTCCRPDCEEDVELFRFFVYIFTEMGG